MPFRESEDTPQLKLAAQDLIASKAEDSIRIRDHNSQIILNGGYDFYEDGDFTNIADSLKHARENTLTVLPEDSLPSCDAASVMFDTEFQVRRHTALECAKELIDTGFKPLVLNFADGLAPGVIPRFKERTQEELNCRASALADCLNGSAMYAVNKNASSAEFV
jgi:uncharacterized protein (TIGR02452 family)